MKYCRDCKHQKFWDCHKDSQVDMVTGESIVRSCFDTRKDETLCGKSATWFEPKDDVPNTPN